MRQIRDLPQLIVTRKAARSLSGGHPWVFAGEVIETKCAPTDGRAARNGDVVDVFEENGTWQGAALLSEESQIRARIISRNANDRFDENFWRRRIEWAWQHRETAMGARGIAGAESDLTCCRVLFSEADGVPGLTVDKYEDVLVSQVTTFGMERLKPVVYPLIEDVLASHGYPVAGIFERCDGAVRQKEGLLQYKGWYQDKGPELDHLVVHENGIAFELDIENSQKTGFFLDQKYNRRAVRKIAKDRRVLDCFCHVGPFGLNALAGGAASCTFCDVSEVAIGLAKRNAELNGYTTEGADAAARFVCADVLEWLPTLRNKQTLREAGGPFDLIVLDPPAFTKTSRKVNAALKGYRQINETALHILGRGGYLCTCSCSQHVTRDLLARAVAEAAHAAGVQLKQVEERQQAPDHPILWGFPESHYLDFFVFQVI